jgi:hypothetical protein
MIKYILPLCLICFCKLGQAQTKSIPEHLAQQQLDAYNKRDIDAFLVPYSDSVEVYFYPNQLSFKGKESMRKSYASMFTQLTALHCKLVKRIVKDNIVIDEESVLFEKGKPRMHAIAIYTIKENKIVRVEFL